LLCDGSTLPSAEELCAEALTAIVGGRGGEGRGDADRLEEKEGPARMYAVCGSSPLSSILLRYEGDSDWVAVVLGGTARDDVEAHGGVRMDGRAGWRAARVPGGDRSGDR